MSLASIFELIQPADWCQAGGLDPLLYDPGNADAWLERLIGVLAGTVTVESLFSTALERCDLNAAAQLLGQIGAESRGDAEVRLQSALRNQIEALDACRLSLTERIDRLLTREDVTGNQNADYLSLIKDDLKRLALPLSTSPTRMDDVAAFREHLSQKERVIDEAELELDHLWTSDRREGVRTLAAVLPYLETKLLEAPGRSSAGEFILRALPALILTGQKELLAEIRQMAIGSGDPSSELREKLSSFDATYSRRSVRRFQLSARPAVPARSTAVASVISTLGKMLVERTRPLTVPAFTDPNQFRAAIAELADGSSDGTAAQIYSAAAATLRAEGHPDEDLLARAAYESGLLALQQRRYSHAMDYFGDSFKLWAFAAAGPFADGGELKRAAAGMLATAFIPRYPLSKATLPVNSWFNSLGTLIAEIVRADETDIVASVSDRLPAFPYLSELVLLLEAEAPMTPWRELLLVRLFRPRKLVAQLGNARERIAALLGAVDEHSRVTSALEAFLVALESAKGRGRVGKSELASMTAAANGLDAATQSPVFKTLREGLLENIEWYQRQVLDRSEQEPLVSVTLLTNCVYPDELEDGICRLIFAIKVDEQSADLSALGVGLKFPTRNIESEGEPETVRLIGERQKTLGAAEAGETKEVDFEIQIDRHILQSITEFEVETAALEGSRLIGDKNKRHTVRPRPRRPTMRSPFTPGKALGRGDVFVGRERELERLKDNLLGDNTEKIPLILGMRRIGKTTILKHLETDPEVRARYVPLMIDLQTMEPAQTTAQFLQHLAKEIRTAGDMARMGSLAVVSGFKEDSIHAFGQFVQSTRRLQGDRRILIIFDEFEKLLNNLEIWRARTAGTIPRADEALIPETLAALRNAMLHAPRLSFVVCGTPNIEREFASVEARMFQLMNRVVLGALSEIDAPKVLSASNRYRLTPDAQVLALRMSGRQPYLLQVIAEALFQHMLESGRDVATMMDVEHVVQGAVLPNKSYTEDYMALIGDDYSLFRAIAIGHKRLGLDRMYVPFEVIMRVFREQGGDLGADVVRQKLLASSGEDRPLVEEYQGKFRLAIGLLGHLLTRGTS